MMKDQDTARICESFL